MTRSETLSVLKILKVSYPAFYSRMTREGMEDVVTVWSEMFREDDVNIVRYALMKVIETHSGYPPDIAAVKGKIKELCQAASGEPTDEEYWQMLREAVSNGNYGAADEFDRLPPVLRRYLRTPNTLREMAREDTDKLNTVTKGQFLKQIGAIRDRDEFERTTPEPVRELLAGVYRSVSDNALPDSTWNDSRNRTLDLLEGRIGQNAGRDT